MPRRSLRHNVPRLDRIRADPGTRQERLKAVRPRAALDGKGQSSPGACAKSPAICSPLNYGFLANSELAALAGRTIRHDPDGGFSLPESDEYGRTSVPGSSRPATPPACAAH